MAAAEPGTVLQHIRRIVSKENGETLTDIQLLDEFRATKEEAAFATLVKRHGPMVLRVCRLVLHHQQDAEDAFQATFLVLARNAAAIRKREALASWLHGVAYRMAMNAKRSAARRRTHEFQAKTTPPEDPACELGWREVQTVLDEEIHRLPEKYRAVFVLCCLEGRSRTETARQLGLKEGTVSSRLDQARKQLQKHLARRGVTLSSVLGVVALSQNASAAAVTPVLVNGTVKAAQLSAAGGGGVAGAISPHVAGLAKAATKAMFASKVKMATAVLLALSLITGAGALAHQALTTNPSDKKADDGPQPVAQGTDQREAAAQNQAHTDRYGDPLPPGAIARLGTVRFRHGDQIYAVAYSPDGKTIASGGLGTIRLWEAATGKPRGTLLGHKMHVFSLTFSQDGKRLVSAGSEDTSSPGVGKLIVWDVAGRRPMFTVDHVGSWVRAAALSSDGLRIAMACDSGTLLLLDANTGRELHTLRQPRGFVNGVAFSPDGRTVAAAGEDNNIQFWDAATGQKKTRLTDAGRLRALAFSPDGKTLASAHDGPQFQDNGVIHLWDLAAGKKRHSLPGHKEMIFSVAFSPDNKYLASSGMHGLVLLWDVATGKQLRKYQAMDSWVSGVEFAPDGRTLVSGSSNGRIQVWDVVTGEERFVFNEHAAGLGDMDLSLDGKQIATASADRTVRLWDVATGRPIRFLRGFERGVYVARFAPDGKRLVTAGGDGLVRLWNPASGTEERRLSSPGDNWDARAAYSLSGKFLATAHVQLIRLWNTATGKEIRQLKGHEGYVIHMAFSPDERFLASAAHSYGDATKNHEDWSVRVWDVARGVEIERISQIHAGQLAFRADSRVLVWLDQDQYCMRRRDLLTGQDLTDTADRDLTAFAFSADGWWLARAQRSGLIRIQEEATGQEVLRFQATPAGVHKLLWAADGRRLISGNGDATVLIWDLSPVGWALEAGQKGVRPEQLQQAWEDLKSPDAMRAYRAVWSMASAGNAAIDLLKRSLRPAPTDARTERIRRLVSDLDHDNFARREAASRELTDLGAEAMPALVETLMINQSLEFRGRAKALLQKASRAKKSPSTHELQTGRALAVLERLGTPEAEDFLKTLAKGAPEARLTQEARASLDRLAKRCTNKH